MGCTIYVKVLNLKKYYVKSKKCFFISKYIFGGGYMEQLRLQAKELRKNKNYKEAEKLYLHIWNMLNEEDKIDKWLGWEYADTLKKLNKIDEAIEISKQVYLSEKNFKYIKDLLAWCSFEKYIKDIEIPETDKEKNEIEKIGKFIIKIVDNDKNTPYLRTIFKFLKIYKKPFNAIKIRDWLELINPNNLSSEEKKFKDKSNKERKCASQKEEWYYLNCKSLFELCKYNECIIACDNALSEIEKFHFDYDIWIKRFKAISMGHIGMKAEAVQTLKELLMSKRHWIIYYNIFQIYIDEGKYLEALIYAYKASLTKDNIRLKINMFEQMGDILIKVDNHEMVLYHYLLCDEIRKENKWLKSEKISKYIYEFQSNNLISYNNIYDKLKKFWIEELIKNNERYEGQILKILQNNKCGFIKCKGGSYYFNVKSMINYKGILKENSLVTFELQDSIDRKKGIKTKEAIEILINAN